MTNRVERDAARSVRLADAWVWSALLLAFSPLWLDWLRHGFDQDWAAYSLLFIPIALWAAWTAPRCRPRVWALAGIVIALAIELAALAWGAPQRGRFALPLAWISACVALGAARLSIAAIAVFWVPVPSLVFKWSSPALEHAQIAFLTSGLSAAGFDVQQDAAWVLGGGERLAVTRFHSGWNVLALAAGLGYWISVTDRSRFSRTACLVFSSLLGAAGQLATLAFAFAGLAVLGADRAGEIMTNAWLVAAVIGVPVALWAIRESEMRHGA